MDHFVSNLGYSLLTNSLSWLFGDQRIVKVGKEAPRSNPKKQGRFMREQKSLSKGKCFSGLVWDIPTPREALQTLDSPLGRGISGITLEKSPIRSLWSLSKMLSISAVEGWVLTSFRLCRTQDTDPSMRIPFPISQSWQLRVHSQALNCPLRAKIRFRSVESTWESSHHPNPNSALILCVTKWVLSHQPWSPQKFQAGFSSSCFSLENSPPGISPSFSEWFFLQCLTWTKSQTTGTSWSVREKRSGVVQKRFIKIK